jgi:hypothetical protein
VKMESPSVIMTVVFFTTLLVVGFGLNGWSLSAVILLMTIGLSFLMVSIDIEAIKKSWSEKRCDLDIIMTSFLYQPDEDPRSTSEFVGDNFQFCMKQTIQEFLKVLMTPLFGALGKQVGVANGLVDVMNVLRNMKGEMMRSFQKLFDPIFDRFQKTGMALSQNMQHMYSAMKRIGGVAIATVYLGMSLQVSIENWMAFVIKVVMIMMGIIASLFAVLFFGLIPFIGILITTLVVLGEGGVNTGGLGSVFCFDPATKVCLQNGTVKTIDRLSVKDILEDGGIVEGVLRTSSAGEQLYSLNGILVSGSHLVWSETREDWIPVSESSLAKPVFVKPDYLVCLRTSTRNIVLRDRHGTPHIFRDWEELPLHLPGVDSFWNYLVTKILKQKETPKTPTEDPLCGPRCEVMLSTGEKLPISMVRIGDTVYSKSGFTKVIGIYEGDAEISSFKGLSNGVWIQTPENWSHPSIPPGKTMRGFHLITQSGTFWIESESHSGFIRDFTEVGIENLPLTYPFTHALLKKSTSKEETCALDSSSLVSLSYLQPIF